MRILIADDDRDQAKIRALLLRHAGFDPVTAFDSESALRTARKSSPVCALIDFRIPDEASGLYLIRELKRLDPEMHIVVLTGLDTARLNRLPERKLVCAVLAKGAPSADLVKRLHLLLNKRATADATARH